MKLHRLSGASQRKPGAWFGRRRGSGAFTLVEIMIVVGIMALIVAMGIPSINYMWNKDPLRQAVYDLTETCKNARARAILSGTMAEIVFHPLERRFEISGGGDLQKLPSTQTTGTFSREVSIEMLDINLLEYNEADSARVRFFPNGTSDEMTVVFQSSKNEMRKISLEVTTALTTVEMVRR